MIPSLAVLAAVAVLAPAPPSTGAVASGPDAPSAPSALDPRIQVLDYDPNRVVSISTAERTATQVQFADDEVILHVALGDAGGWEVAAEGSTLFIKPRAGGTATNLLVTTQRRSGRRHYSFALLPPAKAGSGSAPFVLRFRYPVDDAAAARGRIAVEQARVERRLLDLMLERGVVEGPRNLSYTVQGSSSLAPSEVSDNGRFTVMRFPGNQPMPTVYRVGPDGAEALVPFDVRGEFLVVHGVERQLRLRRGREVVCLDNGAFDPVGRNPGTGSAAADVERTDRSGSGDQP